MYFRNNLQYKAVLAAELSLYTIYWTDGYHSLGEGIDRPADYVTLGGRDDASQPRSNSQSFLP